MSEIIQALAKFEKPIQFAGMATFQESQEILNLIIPRRKRVLIYAVVLGVAFSCIMAARPRFPVGPILMAVVSASFVYFIRRLRRALYDQQYRMNGIQSFEFADEGIRVSSQLGQHHWPWDAFSKFKCDSDYRFLILFFNSTGQICVARSWCANDDDWSHLLQFVRSRLLPEGVEVLRANANTQ